MIPTTQKADILHKLILIQKTARLAAESICESDEAEALAKAPPPLVLATANGRINGPKPNGPAEYAAMAHKIHAQAQAQLGALLGLATALQQSFGATPPDA